jgi:flagellar motor switch protein FliN/FliY
MPEEPASTEDGFDLLLDIPLEISVELGRAKLKVQELLELGQGSVVDLNRLAGEPVDVLVNGRPVAQGEIVVSNERYGVRVVSVYSPSERVESLK